MLLMMCTSEFSKPLTMKMRNALINHRYWSSERTNERRSKQRNFFVENVNIFFSFRSNFCLSNKESTCQLVQITSINCNKVSRNKMSAKKNKVRKNWWSFIFSFFFSFFHSSRHSFRLSKMLVRANVNWDKLLSLIKISHQRRVTKKWGHTT